MGLSRRIRGTRGSVVGVTVRLLQGCGEPFGADHSWGYSYFVGWATRKSWGGLFVIRGVVAVAVVWGVVAVYGAGVISESGPIVSVLGDCAGGYWGDGTHRKFQSGIKLSGDCSGVGAQNPRLLLQTIVLPRAHALSPIVCATLPFAETHPTHRAP